MRIDGRTRPLITPEHSVLFIDCKGKERMEGLLNRLNRIRERYEKTSFRASFTERRLAKSFPALDLLRKTGKPEEEKGK